MTIVSSNAGHAQHYKSDWKWSIMPSVPDASGFAGAFAGQTDAGIMLLGGANFPDGRLPWEGGRKQWTDKVFFLKNDGSEWRECGRLPIRLGYGASASVDNMVFLAGGSNESGHHSKVYKVMLDSDSLRIVNLPPLPMPLANMSGIVIGKTWYIVGGLAEPNNNQAENVCFSLDLERPYDGWVTGSPVPGEGRMLSVLGTDGTSLYVFSGVALREGERHYLKDTYSYRPGGEWGKLPDLRRAVAAAPSPCFYDSTKKQFFIFGGDDGSLAHRQLGQSHPGFSNKIFVFDVEQQKWDNEQTIILSESLPPVTTTSIIIEGGIVFPMGEIKPGIRTTQVIQGSIPRHSMKNP